MIIRRAVWTTSLRAIEGAPCRQVDGKVLKFASLDKALEKAKLRMRLFNGFLHLLKASIGGARQQAMTGRRPGSYGELSWFESPLQLSWQDGPSMTQVKPLCDEEAAWACLGSTWKTRLWWACPLAIMPSARQEWMFKIVHFRVEVQCHKRLRQAWTLHWPYHDQWDAPRLGNHACNLQVQLARNENRLLSTVQAWTAAI